MLAPAGCGKTEALALRVGGLLERKQIEHPRRILVLTFSNRARDNLQERLRRHLSARRMRSTVTVSNLHGFAGRVIRAHGEVIGLTSGPELPSSDWVTDQCRAKNLSYPRAEAAKKALQVVKHQALTDDQVEQALIADGNADALEIEQRRQAEGVLTYDDMLRLAELILANFGVAALYRNHFGAVVVDEFQDLTPQQLRVIQQIGWGRTTYAGDVAQGIYSFAGADPEAALAAIREEVAVEVSLTESYRSSPAVLDTVNALNARTGGSELHAANPDSWPGGGLAMGVAFNDVDEEAAWIVGFAGRILREAPSQRIGVIARSKGRRRFVDDAFVASGLPFRRWDDPLMDAATSTHMRKVVDRIDLENFHVDGRGMEYLVEQADLDSLEEPETRRGVVEGLGWLTDNLNEGVSLDELAGRIKAARSTKLLDASGVHLLSGHVGKGQQFDWVAVIGLEDGSVPNFNARTDAEIIEEARVFAVMVSRARHGLAITRANRVPAMNGTVYPKDPSPFLGDLRRAGVLKTVEAADEWLATAVWAEIAAR